MQQRDGQKWKKIAHESGKEEHDKTSKTCTSRHMDTVDMEIDHERNPLKMMWLEEAGGYLTLEDSMAVAMKILVWNCHGLRNPQAI